MKHLSTLRPHSFGARLDICQLQLSQESHCQLHAGPAGPNCTRSNEMSILGGDDLACSEQHLLQQNDAAELLARVS